MLCARIQQLLDRQGELVPLSCPEEVERHAQRIAAQLLNSAPSGGTGGADGHLFITVIAYQMVQTIRRRLGEQGESESWTSLRRILEGQHRVTATFQRKDGRTLHVRKATRAEPRQQEIYRALALDPAPGGIRKMIV